MGLIHHYFWVALRGLRRNWLYTFVNVSGLALGFSAALLVALYVVDELSYDRWIPNHESIYQVGAGSPGGPHYDVGPSDLGQWLDLDFPQVETVTRLFTAPHPLTRGDFKSGERITWADRNVFEVFDLPVIAGSLQYALDRPDSLVLTRRVAEKYFGRVNVVGETLVLDGEHTMIVTAVLEDLPSNTHLRLRVLGPGHASFSPAAEQDRNPLGWFGQKLWNTHTYVRLAPSASLETFIDNLPDMLDRHGGVDGPRKPSEVYVLNVRPIAEIHLGSTIPGGPSRDLSRLQMFSTIGILIVAGAVINFINLTTALGTRRVVEVGVRKVVGARRRDLIAQFFAEGLASVMLGALLAIIVTAVLIAPLNAFLLRTISVSALFEPGMLVLIAVFCLLTAQIAGAYPSIVLSRLPPAAVLKTRARGDVGRIRQALVVVQFAVLLTLLIATGTVYRQLQFGIDEMLRSEGDQVLTIQTTCPDALKNQISNVVGVSAVACAGHVPQWGPGPRTGIVRVDDAGEVQLPIYYASLEPAYFPLYGIKLVAGRFLSNDIGSDRSPPDNQWAVPEPIVINEQAAAGLGFTTAAEAVGQTVDWNHLYRLPSTFTGDHAAEIVGVVEDFQMGSINSGYVPAAFFYDPGQLGVMSAKLVGDQIPETLTQIDHAWEASGHGSPISRIFFSSVVENIYQGVRRQAQLFATFSFVAVVISILGLIGMAAHESQRRTKEIGLRRVVGGTRFQIIRLLVWHFCQPVLIANVVAWPVAYVAMLAWLEKFERRIVVEPWLFVASACAALFVAMMTVLLQSYRTANASPASALRYE